MTETEFKKLKKKYDPQKIINMHCNNKIRLLSKQIDELIKIRDEKKNAKRNTGKH